MEYPNLHPLDGEDVKNLSNTDLVGRMDDVIIAGRIERYGKNILERLEKTSPRPMVKDLLETNIIGKKSELEQRQILDAGFRFLLQMELVEVSSGIANTVVYSSDYTELKWNSPAHWMKAAVLDQYQTIASRISLECLFELFYLIDKNERIKGKSKFKAFRKWILEEDNPYQYFVGHIIEAFHFDRKHRQAEVHGTSRFAQSLLRLQVPDSEERNISNQLTNILLSVWRPLIEILNGSNPSSISVFKSVENFPSKYFEKKNGEEGFQTFIEDIINEKLK